MKEIIALLSILTINTQILFAQNDVNFLGTTLDLCNYATKGYAYQKKMGLTASKEGYEIKNIHTYTHPSNINLTVDFIGLFQINAKIPQAVIAIANRKSSSPQYICMPHPHTQNEVRNLCEKIILVMPETRIRLYFLAVQDLYMKGKLKEYIQEKHTQTKKDIGWTKEIKDEFLQLCKNEIHPHSEASKKDADVICYYALGKIMQKYKKPYEAKGIVKEVLEIINECNE